MLQKLAEAWPQCVRHFGGVYAHEQKVTNKLVIELRKANRKGRCRVPGRIEAEYTLLEESIASGSVATKGYVDMAVLVGDDEAIYLAYENKWLNVKHDTAVRRVKAREYVLEGLMRYVNEQYSALLPRGYMLGFVFDGDLAYASAKIEAEILKRRTELRCTAGTQWEKVSNCPGTMERRRTDHARKPVTITVDHILLDFVLPGGPA